MPKKLFTVVVVLALLFVGYLGVAFLLHRIDRAPGETTQTAGSAQGSVDQSLVANWDTGCLIPDPKSPWAERHTFTINSDGTGNHKRSSGESCSKLSVDNDDKVTITIPEQGKINLAFTSGQFEGNTLYDIYEVSTDTLKFGHGFCNCVENSGKTGSSESDRFTSLNNFLLYKKQ
ncbi:hypothetical protein HYT33_02350 [Candidatus Roizmanbacteria bacterium]|nr:hypothetical protein [Candidatus Roizmanbacteria bacterium]